MGELADGASSWGIYARDPVKNSRASRAGRSVVLAAGGEEKIIGLPFKHRFRADIICIYIYIYIYLQ